jgi:hypothetical protein
MQQGDWDLRNRERWIRDERLPRAKCYDLGALASDRPFLRGTRSTNGLGVKS